MSENKYASQRAVTTRELAAHPLAPSEAMRRIESDLIAELARLAHSDGRQFKGWPKLSMATDPDPVFRNTFSIRAEVTAVAR